MSYILDALRRADAERERGEVPGLQSQQHAMLDDDDAAPRSRPLVWVIVALVVALAAAIAWNFLGGEPPRSPAVIVAPPMAAVPSVTAPAPAASATNTVTAATTLAASSAAVASSARTTTVAATPTPSETRRPPVRRTAAAPSPTATDSKGAARAAADERVYAYAELPEALRREIPKLAFGGSSYSGSASSRMVILNGQVFHEGDTVAPGLKLRQIKPKNAVLSFKEYRFELSY